MPLPAGHWHQIAQPRRMGARERWMTGLGAALLTALVVAVLISFTSTQRTSGHGCIDVSAATVIGGSELYECGSVARELCAAPAGPGTANAAFRVALVRACRRAGLPLPRS
ncbi:MAG TPA: hypothetical protein VFN87_03400 [Solirubrobacteraceae bacterium]|nr:hypothetical protein [Solirubrobacteraceae bacterium]